MNFTKDYVYIYCITDIFIISSYDVIDEEVHHLVLLRMYLLFHSKIKKW